MRNAIRAAIGLTVAVLAVFGSMGAGDAHRPAQTGVSSESPRH
ncbi:hypothetical protein [Streptosporangium roseum]|uniref:Uncharacterized protein n=1 Tax=Streptosporangium roseum (strain ATCC 12428 / DSM 43021 / JCM 3005 / KCTC 9067 / NCIMB 10171 / NRRL 2505 / NI 9100) TaxID=479432 RepID=D2BEH3_STRRD|nr:hypothetical protein [Streptosporangium roseum]ACZ84336.1 hypothetical protein Sros_1341 [Streptosporangium roseum DSM 43021]